MHTQVAFTVSPEWADILTAELAELGFESFEENDTGLSAYIQTDAFDAAALKAMLARYADQTAILYQITTLEKRNWNAEWEASYQPIEVGPVRVRASFHESDVRFQYDIVINPKMSFGTGHHATTAMMLAQQLAVDHVERSVLDVGSGTGILAILAKKLGAANVVAFDIEEWAVENARENADLNNCPDIEVFQGTIADVSPDRRFDIVLANINRNVLLADIPSYVARLNAGGTLLVSGFYEADASDIQQIAKEIGLNLVQQSTEESWSSLRFQFGSLI